MTKGVVATPHRLATEVGSQILRDGGNAIDALVAADAVLCVVYPHMTSVAGDLMALVWPADGTAPVGLIGAGRSGELATIEGVRARGHQAMPQRGVMPVTVPGTVEAWGRLLERFGSLGFGVLLEPAAALARDGYVITPQLSEFLKSAAPWLSREPAAQALYPPMEAGMLLRNPDLASVLSGIARSGIGDFYRGEVAAAIVSAIARRDGFVSSRDLAAHRSQWVEPIAFDYRDTVVYELPPPSQGLTAAAILVRLAAGLSFKEACEAAYALRERYITDPDFSPAPIEPFLQPDAPVAGGRAHEGGDTVYLCAADGHGNLVSMIQSVAFDFGSGVVAEGTGMLLQNRGAYFSLDPSHVNRLEPKKRTMHTLIPAMASRHGRPWAAFGGMGADLQPQIQAQVLTNLVDHGLAPEDAVARPRLAVLPDGLTVAIEADHADARQWARSGEALQLMPARSSMFGHAHAIVVDGPNVWRAGADPRSDGSVEFVG
ncbi:MAG TPA: gamma-glutamyltransferase family protein [Candidatus Udaeobacter sp.]|nr:gamma-glutamyltransferase family protein [Candidatus Udaeobacter sp.]